MKRYYISANNEKGLEELTENEFFAIMGDDTHRPYANKVYCETMTIDEVPEEYRTTVESIVANKIAKWGLYRDREISPSELENILKGVI